jgi:hypothetical protein
MVKDAVRSGVGGPAYSPYLSPLKSPSYRHFLIRGEKGKPGGAKRSGGQDWGKGARIFLPGCSCSLLFLERGKASGTFLNANANGMTCCLCAKMQGLDVCLDLALRLSTLLSETVSGWFYRSLWSEARVGLLAPR